jgi:UDP-N-acetylmuramate: L-alanyl-gamma-D-glutamyl-meso-diaminopimelate ligase
MRMGVHADRLAEALAAADRVWVYLPEGIAWDAHSLMRGLGARLRLAHDTQSIVDEVAQTAAAGDQVLVMSNGGFEGIHQRLLDALADGLN